MNKIIFLLVSLLVVPGFAQDYSFIKPNEQRICQLIAADENPSEVSQTEQPPEKLTESKTKSKFYNLIDQIRSKYDSILKKNNLEVKWTIDWDESIENAFAAPNGGGAKRELKLYGGLFRNKLVSSEAYLFVVCHEVGHIMGGAPQHAFYPEFSAEGQADYYATNTCLPIVYADQDNVSFIKKLKIPLSVKLDCDRTWNTKESSAICQRSIMAAYELSTFLMRNTEEKKPSFTKPDLKKSEETVNFGYPEKQCRFDTMMAGALCTKNLNSTQQLGDAANCSLSNFIQSEAARPQCWFKTPGM